MAQPQPYILLPPTDPAAVVSEWLLVAIESHQLGRYPDAERQLRHTLHLEPNNARAYNNLACAYAAGNNHKEALLAIERAGQLSDVGPYLIRSTNAEDLKFQEVFGIVLCNWALISLDMEQVDLAYEKASRAVAVYPSPQTRVALALCCPISGEPQRALPLYNAVLDENPKHFVAGMNAAFAQTLIDATPKELLQQRKRFYEGQRQVGSGLKHHKLSLNGKPLRVGYVSGDFRRHSASSIFGAVALHHSPQVEPYFYSTQPVDVEADAVSKRYKTHAGERWRDLAGVSDEKAEELIRKDRIDVLVDLSGHTGGTRLGLFTRKPAPVQVAAWGFAHGTGCPEMDYFFADPVAVPEEERQYYAEKVVDLPCIVTYEPPEYDLSGVSPPPCEKNGYVTFGCFSRYEKLSQAYLATVQEVLLAVPDSRMEFKDNAFRRPQAVQRVLEIMDAVDPRRLSFRIGTSQPDHMLCYQRCDLILDPFPHSGGTACLEQLWMGVPIITLYGTQAAGRTTSSVLTCIGRDRWVAKTKEEYIHLATGGSWPTSASRQALRQELLDSPVVKGYVEAVEETYFNLVKEKAECITTK